jgi:hypothetical protein
MKPLLSTISPSATVSSPTNLRDCPSSDEPVQSTDTVCALASDVAEQSRPPATSIPSWMNFAALRRGVASREFYGVIEDLLPVVLAAGRGHRAHHQDDDSRPDHS